MKDDNSTSLTESASICAGSFANYGGKEMYKFKDWKDVEEKTGDITHKQGLGEIVVMHYIFANDTGTRYMKSNISHSTNPVYQQYIGAIIRKSDGSHSFIKLNHCSRKLAMHLDREANRLTDAERSKQNDTPGRSQ